MSRPIVPKAAKTNPAKTLILSLPITAVQGSITADEQGAGTSKPGRQFPAA